MAETKEIILTNKQLNHEIIKKKINANKRKENEKKTGRKTPIIDRIKKRKRRED